LAWSWTGTVAAVRSRQGSCRPPGLYVQRRGGADEPYCAAWACNQAGGTSTVETPHPVSLELGAPLSGPEEVWGLPERHPLDAGGMSARGTQLFLD
jgi:hypothetical protein